MLQTNVSRKLNLCHCGPAFLIHLVAHLIWIHPKESHKLGKELKNNEF